MRARPAVVLAVITALVVAMATVALVVSSTRPTPVFDLRTPDGTAQAYVAAIVRGDDGAAVGLLDPALGCGSPLPWSGESRASIAVVRTEATGDRATVVLDISERQGGPFGDVWSHRETFELVRVGEGWLVTGEPWPVHVCR